MGTISRLVSWLALPALALAVAGPASADMVYVSGMSGSGVFSVASDGTTSQFATQIIDSTGGAIALNGKPIRPPGPRRWRPVHPRYQRAGRVRVVGPENPRALDLQQ